MSEQQNLSHVATNAMKIVETIKDGKLPSNAAINTELEATKEYLQAKEKDATNVREEKILKDARLLVEATQETLEEKNPDSQLQRFIKDVQKVAEKATDNATTGKIEARMSETREFLSSLRDLMEPLLQSTHFRKVLSDTAHLIIEIIKIKTPEIADEVANKVDKSLESGSCWSAPPPSIYSANPIEKTPEKETSVLDDIPPAHLKEIRELFKELLKELKSTPESTKAYRNFLKLMRHLHTDLFTELEKGQADRDVQKVELDAKKIVESFTGGKTLDNFLLALRKALNTIENDRSLSNYLKDIQSYVERGLDDPELVLKDEFLDKGDELIKRGYNLANKYQNNRTLNRAVDEAAALLEEMRKDEGLNQLKQRAINFIDNFTYEDKHGNRRIDLDIIGQMKSDIIPFLSERIKEIPIPNIEIHNKEFEYLKLDQLYLTIDEILPNMINIHTENDLDFNVKELKADRADSYIKFKIKGLKPKLKDFHFAFKRMQLIELVDEGRASVTVTGAGLDIFLDFNITLKNGVPSLGSHRTKVTVHKLDVDIIDAKHKFMLNIFTTLFSGSIEKQVEDALQKKIDEYGSNWADYVNKQILQKLPTAEQIKQKIEEKVPTLH